MATSTRVAAIPSGEYLRLSGGKTGRLPRFARAGRDGSPALLCYWTLVIFSIAPAPNFSSSFS